MAICKFDENEVEYRSCQRPQCSHVECVDHEEYEICMLKKCMQKYIGKSVYGVNDGQHTRGTLNKVFSKGNKPVYKILCDDEIIRTFADIKIPMYN